MLFDFAKRRTRRKLVLEFNPHQVLAAEITRVQRDALYIESTAEFAREDEAGLTKWLEGKAWPRVICGLVPVRGILQRETLNPRAMTSPDYLANAIEEQQKGQFLSATPFKLVNPEAWTLRAVNAVDGSRLPAEGPPQSALITGMANVELQQVQQQLHDDRISPERIESGLLSLFGAFYEHFQRRGEMRAIAVVVVHESATAIYILGKEGVHAPNPILHGLGAIADLLKKELELKDDAEALRVLHSGETMGIQRADRLARRIGRDLKPVLDSYEMTTGQPLGEIFCACLPPNLAWLPIAIAKATGRSPTNVNVGDWMTTVGLLGEPDARPLGQHWLGALSLVAQLPDVPPRKSARSADAAAAHHRSWHVDFKLDAISSERLAASRRFVTGAVAAALALIAVALTSWQLYAINSLTEDSDYWEQEIAANRRLFEELTASNAKLQAQSSALKQACDLMAIPYQPSDLFINLGRTIPPRTRIDGIDLNDTRLALSGILLRPAEEAAGTLGEYVAELRRNPAIGPLFSSIAITALQRKGAEDSVLFEITFRFKPPAP